jgi:hypothetical protein
MKYLSAVCLLCLAACTTPSELSPATDLSTPSSQRELLEVKGSAVSFGIETFSWVSCTQYDQQFLKATPLLITDKVRLARISQRLQGLRPAPNGYGIDVRAKVVLRYNDQSCDTLCLGNFTSHYQGRLVVADTMLLSLLSIGQ